MLKEARIVMPYKVISGVREDHAELRKAIVEAFGGFTVAYGSGGWRNHEGSAILDAVAIYDIAIEAERDASWDQLFHIAMQAGRDLNQEAVYIRYPDGTVCIEPVHGREGLGGLQRPTEANGGIKDRIGEDLKAPAALADKPLGTKRLPQVGEVWRARTGELIAILSQASVLDGGYNTVTLTRGETAINPGRVGLHDLDGKPYGGARGGTSPFDLISFVTRFDR